ncbi:hypothetical protein HQQ94_03120 [Shewanella sp. VB17]|uniref:hypothetical protein n=1 Tax=Shewanella sp. VB17 TaxID=2739432 RepID=UPI001565E517|nr:hypothetical protein [Shewanella sp. VB17]NRD72245.1 hypothetical protein [Shewanella sp. VB17]
MDIIKSLWIIPTLCGSLGAFVTNKLITKITFNHIIKASHLKDTLILVKAAKWGGGFSRPHYSFTFTIKNSHEYFSMSLGIENAQTLFIDALDRSYSRLIDFKYESRKRYEELRPIIGYDFFVDRDNIIVFIPQPISFGDDFESNYQLPEISDFLSKNQEVEARTQP